MCQGHHHLFPGKKEDEPPVEAPAHGSGPDGAHAETTKPTFDFLKDLLHRAELQSAAIDAKLHDVAIRAIPMREKPEANKDLEDAHRHKIEEESATSTAAAAKPEADNKKEEKHCKHTNVHVGAVALPPTDLDQYH
ncbi:abscisic stress-ripening protein 5-like [Eucalyptus grandis]|uniref:abscisic stress-ripening protein 5-like n=1 Tax=Eucalyptus grandis TaxID=71139 RepID=UPI00192EE7B8|nr:abscisic stress-ripening protein 5-like [Eucalyptus grandis]